MKNINELPNEVLVLIFEFFSPASLEHGISLVCKKWKQLARITNVWKETHQLGVFCCFSTYSCFEQSMLKEQNSQESIGNEAQLLIDEMRLLVKCLSRKSLQGQKSIHVTPMVCSRVKSENCFHEYFDSRRKLTRDFNKIGYLVNHKQELMIDVFFRVLSKCLQDVDICELDFTGLLQFGSVFVDIDATALSSYYSRSERISFSTWFSQILNQCKNLSSLNIADIFTRYEPSLLALLQVRSETLRILTCSLFTLPDLKILSNLINLHELNLNLFSLVLEECEGFSFSQFKQLEVLRITFDRSPVGNVTLKRIFSITDVEPKIKTLHLLFWNNDVVPDISTMREIISPAWSLSDLKLIGVGYDPHNGFKFPTCWSENLRSMCISAIDADDVGTESPLEDFFSKNSIIETVAFDSLDWIPLDYEENVGCSVKELIIYGPAKPACLPDYPNIQSLRLSSCLSCHSFQRIRNFRKLKHLQLHFEDERFLIRHDPQLPNPLSNTLANFFKHYNAYDSNDESPLQNMESIILLDCLPHLQWSISRCRQISNERLISNHFQPFHLHSSVFVNLIESCQNLRCLDIDCQSPQCDPYSENDINPLFASKFGILPDLVPLLKSLKYLQYCKLRLNLTSVRIEDIKKEITACEESLAPLKQNFLFLSRFELVAFVHWSGLTERDRSRYGLSTLVREIFVNCYGCWRRNWKFVKAYPCNLNAPSELMKIP